MSGIWRVLIRRLSEVKRLTKDPILPEKHVRRGEAKSFIDYKYVKCCGGNGGDGMIAFLREYGVPFGGPSGGDGGNGGHVIFQADSKTMDLSQLKPVIIADYGRHGEGKNCHGKGADHLIVKVPLGTVFRKPGTTEILADLKHDGAMYLGARGGAGGHGNHFYVSNMVRIPLKAERGGVGEKRDYDIEMRIMATAGFVGFPNVGKSSLLRAISRAKPKVASYPFTTLAAHVGMVAYDDFVQVPVADIPGLIEGSHLNIGLGINFLKHLTRCHCLFYVLDHTLSNLRDQFIALQNELNHFDTGLAEKPITIVVNKWDISPKSVNEKSVRQMFPSNDVFFVSAKYSEGLEALLVHLRTVYDEFLREDD